jgi:hypothetical protein
MYSSYSFMALVLDGVSGQCHTPAMLKPRGRKPHYPLDRRLGGEIMYLDISKTYVQILHEYCLHFSNYKHGNCAKPYL